MTKIIVGNTYEISPTTKKAFCEIQVLTSPKRKYSVEFYNVYRGGSVDITPQNEDEAQNLQFLLDNNLNLDLRKFSDWVLCSAWDGGCDFGVDWSDDHIGEWIEEQWENDEEAQEEHWGMQVWLEDEKGWDCDTYYYLNEIGLVTEDEPHFS